MPDIRQELVSVGERRGCLRAALAVSELELRRLIVVGRSEGLSVAEMCRLGQVSRETAHKALRSSRPV